jgi:hypothetical protein
MRDRAASNGDVENELCASREVGRILTLKSRDVPKVAAVAVPAVPAGADQPTAGYRFAVSGLAKIFKATEDLHPWCRDSSPEDLIVCNVEFEIVFVDRTLIDAQSGMPVNEAPEVGVEA